MSGSPLISTLNRFRQRVLAVGGTAGLLWMLAGAILCLMIGVWLDLLLDLAPVWRLAIVAAAGMAAIFVFARKFTAALSDGRMDVLARRLDAAARTGGQILCGVELMAAQSAARGSSQTNLTTGLASLAINRAANLAGGIPGASVASSQPLQRSGGLLLMLAALGLGACWLMPRLAATEWSRFSDPFGDHPPFTNVFFDVEPGDARVVYGSGLEIHVTVTGSLVDDVELVMQPAGGSPRAGETLPMFPETGGKWRAAISNLVAPAEYFVRARNARSEKFQIAVITVPKIEEVVFRITPPDYTQLPPTEGPLPAGGLAGLPGTKIQATVRSNRPLSGGTLAYVTKAGRNEIPLTAGSSSAESVTGEFTITDTGRIEIQVADVERQSSTEPWTAPVALLVDERPFIRLLEPKAISFASPSAVIPVVISAEDDYGISRLQLFRNLNDSSFLPLTVPLAKAAARTAYQVIPLPLIQYGVEAGDEIKLFARVEDNDPHASTSGGQTNTAGKGTESTIAVIRIISEEEFERLRQTREGMDSLLSKYQQVRRRMESVAEEMEEIQKKLAEESPNEKASEKMRDELERLSRKLDEEADALRKIREERRMFKLDDELAKELLHQEQALRQLRKRIQELSEDEEKLNEELAQEMQRLREELQQNRERLDQEVMEPLEFLAKVFALKQDEAKFVLLYRRQRDLANRLESVRHLEDTDDPAVKARMRDLESEQRQIRTDLDALLNEIEEHASRLPEDESYDELRKSATDFAQEVRKCGASEAMTDAESGLAEFSGKRGHAGAKKAADLLEKFLSKNEEMGNQARQAGGQRFQPGMGDAMNQTMDQLLQGMGLGQQPGMGEGSGGGYSSRQNTMDNVGLYGSSPRDESQQSGSGTMSRPRSGDGRGAAARQEDDRDYRAGNSLDSQRSSTGGSEALVPLRYRRQVGRYFQRIADELDAQ